MLHGGADAPHDHDPEHALSDTIQATLLVYVDGQQVDLPAGIGVDGNDADIAFARSETNNGLEIGPFNGVNPTDFITAGDFFDTWRTNAGAAGNNPNATLASTELLGNLADSDTFVQMFVNGIATRDFENYEIHDQDRIVLSIGDNPIVSLNTTHGSVPVELFSSDAPGTVGNFFNYSNDGRFDDSLFHRLASNFVLQGGGFNTPEETLTNVSQFTSINTDPPIQNEFGISNTRGTVAMAKQAGNPNSATSQFFFNLNNNSGNLDNQNGGFTVFGQALDMFVPDAIAQLTPTDLGGAFGQLPLENGSQLAVLRSVEGTGVVQGIKFHDADQNGVRDNGEVVLPGWVIYADANDNGALDEGEISTETDSEGRYGLNLPAGTHIIREVLQPGFTQTTPTDGHSVTLALGDVVVDQDFGNALTAVPGTPDLDPSSDSGVADDDDLTNHNNTAGRGLSVTVPGVLDGAFVRLFAGNVEIGTATASGSSVTIATGENSQLADGTQTLTATQIVGGVESAASAGLDITIDSTVGQFTSTPPAASEIAVELTYDVQHDEEGDVGFQYSLVSGPDGAVIDADGVITWTPTANQLGSESFSVQAEDVAGNTALHDFDVAVNGDPSMRYRLLITDLNNNEITSASVGDEFLLNVFVQDLRFPASGVFAGYLDVAFENSLVSANGDIVYGTEYQNVRSGTAQPGLLDEIGAAAGFNELGSDEFLLLSVPMIANTGGQEMFVANPADILPDHETLLFGTGDGVVDERIIFGTATLNIDLAFSTNDDTFNVNEDSSDNELDVLLNDSVQVGSPGDLTIVSVGTTDNGGTVSIRADGKRVIYTPAADFFGTDTFTYSASDSTGTLQATVEVQVQPTNDDPTGVADTFTVQEDTADNLFDVLANDEITPDAGETLTVSAVGASANGGTITIGPGGTHVLYSPPADFIGQDTFTYTISDGNGGSSQGSVTVEVVEQNDDPIANADAFDVQEDSVDNSLDVLQNDSTGPDINETLTILSVTQPTNGQVDIVNGTSLEYTPDADAFGKSTFSYTIGDGRGGTATATVTVTILESNDPPTANADTLSVIKDTAANELNVLLNDTSAPDENETLTISNLGTTTAGGTVVLNQDNSRVLYTPPAGFSGTDTFTYSVLDSNGGVSGEETVTVQVQDFAPGSISGFVYVDVNNDGVMSSQEATIGDVVITLTGTDFQGNDVNLVVNTDVLGRYSFLDLAPGTYTVMQEQPIFLVDGIDTIGSQGGDSSVNDQFTIVIAQDSTGTQATDNNFGERGRKAAYIGLVDLLASTPEESLTIVEGQDVDRTWFISSGWSSEADYDLQSSDADTLELTEVNGVTSVAVIPMLDARRVQHFGSDGALQLIRLAGVPDDYHLQQQSGSDGGGSGEGEAADSVPPAPPIAAAISAPPAAAVVVPSADPVITVGDGAEGEAFGFVSLPTVSTRSSSAGQIALPPAAEVPVVDLTPALVDGQSDYLESDFGSRTSLTAIADEQAEAEVQATPAEDVDAAIQQISDEAELTESNVSEDEHEEELQVMVDEAAIDELFSEIGSL